MTDIEYNAVFSPNGKHRYLLTRTWDHELPKMVWIMLNPSVADEHANDNTIVKCIGFAQHESRLNTYGGIEVYNLFTRVTPYPHELWRKNVRNGAEADEYLARAFNRLQDTIVCGWGVNGAHPVALDRIVHVIRLAKTYEKQLMAFGFTGKGMPRHPGRIAYETPLTTFWTPMQRTW